MAKNKLLLVLLMATTASLVAGRSLYLWERTSEIVSDKETFHLLLLSFLSLLLLLLLLLLLFLLLLLLLFELVTVLYDFRRFSYFLAISPKKKHPSLLFVSSYQSENSLYSFKR